MFDTMTNSINSILGVTILLIVVTTIFSLFFESPVTKQTIKLIGIMLYIFFILGCLFFKDIVETVFNVTSVGVGLLLIVCLTVWFIREISKSVKLAVSENEQTAPCQNCELYEECLDRHKPNCPYFTEDEIDL